MSKLSASKKIFPVINTYSVRCETDDSCILLPER